MIEFLIQLNVLAFTNALIIVALFKAYSYEDSTETIPEASKMIFWKIHYTAKRYLSPLALKPLFSCVWCMASVYSVPVYWYYFLSSYPFSYTMVINFIFYIPMVSCMAGYINSKIDAL